MNRRPANKSRVPPHFSSTKHFSFSVFLGFLLAPYKPLPIPHHVHSSFSWPTLSCLYLRILHTLVTEITMLTSSLLALAASLSTTSAAALQGFNYGSAFTNGAPKQQSDFQSEFATAKNLVGTSGFTSARLYTTVVSPYPIRRYFMSWKNIY